MAGTNKVEPMADDDERKLWRNWTYLKHELRIEELTEGMVKSGRFKPEDKETILTVQPNTKFMKAEKFLSILIRSGKKGFQAFSNLLINDPRNLYAEVIEKLELNSTDDISDEVSQAGSLDSSRVASAKSNLSGGTSISSKDGETGEKKRKSTVPDILTELPGQIETTPRDEKLLRTQSNLLRQISVVSATPSNKKESPPSISTTPRTQSNLLRQASTASAKISNNNSATAVQAVLQSSDSNRGNINLSMLEQELVKIAPTIADLFQRISKTNEEQPKSAAAIDLNAVKEENERLRKTNRNLIEKLNIFQQQIINLQLENKKLRANEKADEKSKEEINKKNQELENLRQKFENQKKELQLKEAELDRQLEKIRAIEEENERQKIQIMKLEVLHDESVDDRKEQQDQIEQLRQEKANQQSQIDALKEKQALDEERLQKMEARLLLLENTGGGSRASYFNRNRDKNKRSSRVMSPPRAMPWMNGVLNRSHNANVKFNPPSFNPREKPQEKGWSF